MWTPGLRKVSIDTTEATLIQYTVSIGLDTCSYFENIPIVCISVTFNWQDLVNKAETKVLQ